MTSKVDFIKVNLSDPCIYSLIQCSENPTLAVEYNTPQNNKNSKIVNGTNTNIKLSDQSESQSNTQSNTQSKIQFKIQSETQKSDIVRNIFVVVLVLLLIYAICLLMNNKNNKNNKKYFFSPIGL
jgi:hypothetical protein